MGLLVETVFVVVCHTLTNVSSEGAVLAQRLFWEWFLPVPSAGPKVRGFTQGFLVEVSELLLEPSWW